MNVFELTLYRSCRARGSTQRLASAGTDSTIAAMSVCICPHHLGRLRDVAGGGAELLDLGVDVVEVVGCGADPHLDAELLQLAPARLSVSAITRSGSYDGDRLDVGLEPGEVGHLRLRLGRVVGLVVDRDHLVAGADREEHLGAHRRQADDRLRRRVAAGRLSRRRGGGDRTGVVARRRRAASAGGR